MEGVYLINTENTINLQKYIIFNREDILYLEELKNHPISKTENVGKNHKQLKFKSQQIISHIDQFILVY